MNARQQEISNRAMNCALNTVGFSPRFLAWATGCSLTEAIATCKRLAGRGALKAYQREGNKNRGEIYYCQNLGY